VSAAPMPQWAVEQERVQNTVSRVEQTLLGAILILGRQGVDRAAGLVTTADFVSDSHRLIFDSIGRVAASGASPDLVLVLYELETSKTLERAGGPAVLSALVDRVPDVENVEFYARLVKTEAQRRKMNRLKA
jgi:replicative DNA helicase